MQDGSTAIFWKEDTLQLLNLESVQLEVSEAKFCSSSSKIIC